MVKFKDYSLHLLIRGIPDHYAIYGSASCHCDHTVHIAELVMSQKMAAFVLALWGKCAGGSFTVYLLILPNGTCMQTRDKGVHEFWCP